MKVWLHSKGAPLIRRAVHPHRAALLFAQIFPVLHPPFTTRTVGTPLCCRRILPAGRLARLGAMPSFHRCLRAESHRCRPGCSAPCSNLQSDHDSEPFIPQRTHHIQCSVNEGLPLWLAVRINSFFFQARRRPVGLAASRSTKVASVWVCRISAGGHARKSDVLSTRAQAPRRVASEASCSLPLAARSMVTVNTPFTPLFSNK